MKLLLSLIERGLKLLKDIQLPDLDGPPDSLVGVRAPRRSGPGGGSSAVALREPDEELTADATARSGW